MRHPHLWAILAAYRQRLESLYGDRLAQVILYGSQARGDATDGSDIDVLVVLKGPVDRRVEDERIFPIVSDLSLEHDVALTSFVVPLELYVGSGFSLYRNVREQGVTV